jgi:carotenoid 1,2-hydratase
MNHCCLNVALYGETRRWAMTERAQRFVSRSADAFHVGPSAMVWDENGLTISIHEICSPIPFPLRGEVKLTPHHLYDAPVALDAAGRHHWRAVATGSRIEVSFDAPRLSWGGTAYHDMNWGAEPLEDAFCDWTWSRAETAAGTSVLYDVTTRANERRAFGRSFRDGTVSGHPLPERHELPRGLWGMRRPLLSERTPELKQKLEDAPFYTRNHVGLTLDGKEVDAVHESLSLTRFAHPVVQWMLPFRMPRRG